MEEEEREAQSAKLQELIRRGTPEDLQEANRLMKVMAGYDTRSKTDYRAKAAEDVAKIQAKARLLEERLEAFQSGDTMKDGDVFSELASALQSAQPKIQKMCEEESDDHEAVARLLEINDSIHRTVERYKLMKKGDIEGAKKVAAGAPPPSTSASKSPAAELSLIDFDADANANGTAGSQSNSQAGTSLENDLLGLSIGETSSFGQTGGISLGFGTNTSRHSPTLNRQRKRERQKESELTRFGRYSWAGITLLGDTKQQCEWVLVFSPSTILFSIRILHVSSGFTVDNTATTSFRGFQASSSTSCRSICCTRRIILAICNTCTTCAVSE
jgi:hypothetical protein